MESVQAWVDDMRQVFSTQMCEKVVVICWAIWENRNNMLWNNQCQDPVSLVRQAFSFVDSWKSINVAVLDPNNNTGHRLGQGQGCPPHIYALKVNIDVAMDFQHGRMGFGWVVRDEEGIVQGVAMQTIDGTFTVREAEAMRVREALSWIKKRGCQWVILETDAQVFTKAMQRGGGSLSPYGGLINEICILLQ